MSFDALEERIINLKTKFWGWARGGTPLGTKLRNEVVSIEEGTPVQPIAASNLLTMDNGGQGYDGETVAINNPSIIGSDIYEFDTDGELSDITHIPVDLSGYLLSAAVILTVGAAPALNDTITIGEKTYTFVASGDADEDGEIGLPSGLAAQQAAIVDAINGTDGYSTPHALVRASNFLGNNCVITAIRPGTEGNSITVASSFDSPSSNFFSDENLSGGTVPSAFETIDTLVNAILANDTQGVTAIVNEEGEPAAEITANTTGTAGNSIITITTMTEAEFATGTLTGGGGTFGSANTMMIDDEYLYIWRTDSWRRIALAAIE